MTHQGYFKKKVNGYGAKSSIFMGEGETNVCLYLLLFLKRPSGSLYFDPPSPWKNRGPIKKTAPLNQPIRCFPTPNSWNPTKNIYGNLIDINHYYSRPVDLKKYTRTSIISSAAPLCSFFLVFAFRFSEYYII